MMGKSEKKFLAAKLQEELNIMTGLIRENPWLMTTVQSTVAAKLRKKGARLYRGDNCLGSLAQKHCVIGAAHLTRTDECQWMGSQDRYEVCRLVSERILNKGPKFRFPGREMLVTDWLVWLDKMAVVAKVPILAARRWWRCAPTARRVLLGTGCRHICGHSPR